MTDVIDAFILARQGFHVFPLRPQSKLPAIEKFPERATRDRSTIEGWMAKYPGCNWGISTSRYGDAEALLVVDVDSPGHGAGKKDGSKTLLRLELDGRDFPLTREHATPTGGKHMLYRVPAAVRQGVDVLGSGVDIRSKGGYIVAPGSRVSTGGYFVDCPAKLEPAPQWLIDACGPARERTSNRKPLPNIDPARASERAVAYLRNEAPEAISGAGGDLTTFKVAAKLKDLGVSPEVAVDLMLECWFDGCGWTVEELTTKVRNAYKYGENPQGADAPEAQFEPVIEDDANSERPTKLAPLRELNKQYAMVLHKGEVTIYREHRGDSGQCLFYPMKSSSFDLALQTVRLEGKPIAQKWKEWPGRRFYENGLDFVPEGKAANGVLNLWGGFAVEEKAGDWSLFHDHIRDIVCGGDASLHEYVLNWLAHSVQRPHRPPGVAIVLRGGEGAGKGTFAKLVGDMFGDYYQSLTHSDHLTGRFNTHLACKVLLFADEAFFAGDRKAIPALKSLLTEDTMLMEAKGFDAVRVRNCAHVIMASNEAWIVPASHDQRRFCVIDVSAQHKRQKSYFDPIFVQMREAGGTEAMLYDLKRRDISAFDVGKFPDTAAGSDQKMASLQGPARWLHSVLTSACVTGEEWGEEPLQVVKSDAYSAYGTYARTEAREWRAVPDMLFWKELAKILGTALQFTRPRIQGGRQYACLLPPLAEARKAFERFFGGRALQWDGT